MTLRQKSLTLAGLALLSSGCNRLERLITPPQDILIADITEYGYCNDKICVAEYNLLDGSSVKVKYGKGVIPQPDGTFCDGLAYHFSTIPFSIYIDNCADGSVDEALVFIVDGDLQGDVRFDTLDPKREKELRTTFDNLVNYFIKQIPEIRKRE